jgi:hypothetical protein
MSNLSVDEMDDLAGYILNKRATLSTVRREVLGKVTTRNLSTRLKG